MFYLTTHSTHFIYGYMASDIWLRTILIVRKETRCRHIGYSYRLTARVLLYAPSHRQDNTYHGLCYTSRGALAGTRNRWVKSYLNHWSQIYSVSSPGITYKCVWYGGVEYGMMWHCTWYGMYVMVLASCMLQYGVILCGLLTPYNHK